jgi:hypothetical protein
LDWTLIRNGPYLRRLLTRYVEHYNTGRPHRGIDVDATAPAPVATATMLPGAAHRSGHLAQLARVARRHAGNLADAPLAPLAPLAPSLLNCQRRVAGFSVERIKARLDHLLGWALSRSTGGSGPGGGKRPAARRTS